MTTLPDLVPPWSSIPLVNDDTRIFPEPTMTAVAAAVTEAVVSSPELSATIGEKVQPVANDVVASAVTAQDIPGKVATATGAAIADANIPGLVDAAAGPAVTAEATEQLPGFVTAEVALRVPPAVDTAITGADIPGKVAIALAAQAGKIVQGTGMPNGVVTAGVGTLYVDTAATNGAGVWRKGSGSGATGWVIVEGDTGLRRVDPLNGWTTQTGYLMLRRTAVLVTLAGYVIRGTDSLLFTVPTGFRPAANLVPLVPYGVSTPSPAQAAEVLTSGTVRILGTSTGTHYMSMTWETKDNWPTTLPGTAA